MYISSVWSGIPFLEWRVLPWTLIAKKKNANIVWAVRRKSIESCWNYHTSQGLKYGIHFESRSEIGYGKSHILVWNRVRVFRTGRTPPPKNIMNIPPGLKLPLGNAETDDKKSLIFKANKVFLVCLFLAILFHEVQAICLSIATLPTERDRRISVGLQAHLESENGINLEYKLNPESRYRSKPLQNN